MITKFACDDQGEAMDWDALKAVLRPSSAGPEWDQMWDREIRSYGSTVGDYVRLLSEAATLRWVWTGDRTAYIDENLRFFISEKLTEQRSRLSGHIFLDDLIHPAGGVMLSVVNEEGEAGYAVSECDGLIRFEGLAAGTFRVNVVDHVLVAGPETVTIPATGEVSGQVWVVRKGGTIHGRVEAPVGPDFMDTSVLARNEQGVLFTGKLDGVGRYSIRGLPDGVYGLSYIRSNLYCQNGNITIENGETVYANDILCFEGGSVSGRVTAQSSGSPLGGVVVSLLGEDHLGSVVTDGDGTYHLSGIKPGFYTVVAYREGYRSDPHENVEVLAGETTAGIDFAMQKGAQLHGIIVEASGGAPVGGAFVWLFNGEGALIDRAVSSSSGGFGMEDLPSGTFKFKVEHYRYNAVEQTVSLFSGSITEVPIVLSQGTSISGTVTNSVSGSGLGGHSAAPFLVR